MARDRRGLCGVRYSLDSKLDEGFALSLLNFVIVATARSASTG
ncbi:MAG: hypothetical protein OJF60_002444 [Burkholderiaceae bacterium]|jgi:hypothetical protein|nr:MAG: hypothetical protein OJF60_002444 [Burkholderiaceae bacterium]